jgi:hypothetical protein
MCKGLEWWVLLSSNICGICKDMNNHHHKREPNKLSIHLHTATPNEYARKSWYICTPPEVPLDMFTLCNSFISKPRKSFPCPNSIVNSLSWDPESGARPSIKTTPKRAIFLTCATFQGNYGHKKCLPLELTTKTNSNQA